MILSLFLTQGKGKTHSRDKKKMNTIGIQRPGIGLDYLSAFKFKDFSRRLEWNSKEQLLDKNLNFLDEFKNDIVGFKRENSGKLFHL